MHIRAMACLVAPVTPFIDIGKIFCRSLEDVKVKRGADVASDNHMLTETQVEPKLDGDSNKHTKVQCGPPERSTCKRRIHYDTNKVHVLLEWHEEEPDPNSQWQKVKQTLT